MSDPGWLLSGVQLEETPFLQAVIDAHQTIYQEHFADELMLNHPAWHPSCVPTRELDDCPVAADPHPAGCCRG